MASQLTKAQVNKILEKFEDPDYPPFVGVTAKLVGVSPDLAEAAYENGRLARGTPLENEFHTKVNMAQGTWAFKALQYINDPYLSKGKEPRARQLMALLSKLEPQTFGGKPKPVPKVGPASARRAAELTKEDIDLALGGLEEPEQ